MKEVKGQNPTFSTQQIKGNFIHEISTVHVHIYNVDGTGGVYHELSLRVLLYCSFHLGLYADAACRFYRSKCEEESIKRRGKSAILAKQKRKHERLSRVCVVLVCTLYVYLTTEITLLLVTVQQTCMGHPYRIELAL